MPSYNSQKEREKLRFFEFFFEFLSYLRVQRIAHETSKVPLMVGWWWWQRMNKWTNRMNEERERLTHAGIHWGWWWWWWYSLICLFSFSHYIWVYMFRHKLSCSWSEMVARFMFLANCLLFDFLVFILSINYYCFCYYYYYYYFYDYDTLYMCVWKKERERERARNEMIIKL